MEHEVFVPVVARRPGEAPAHPPPGAGPRLLNRFAENLAAGAETEGAQEQPAQPEATEEPEETGETEPLVTQEFEPKATSDFETTPDADDAPAPAAEPTSVYDTEV